jgi:hypothetical protein
MITKQTCADIYNTMRELEEAEKLLLKFSEHGDDWVKVMEAMPRDAKRSHSRAMTIRIPMHDPNRPYDEVYSCHDVSPRLAKLVLVTHIADMKARLVELQGAARLELDNDAIGVEPPSQAERAREFRVMKEAPEAASV